MAEKENKAPVAAALNPPIGEAPPAGVALSAEVAPPAEADKKETEKSPVSGESAENDAGEGAAHDDGYDVGDDKAASESDAKGGGEVAMWGTDAVFANVVEMSEEDEIVVPDYPQEPINHLLPANEAVGVEIPSTYAEVQRLPAGPARDRYDEVVAFGNVIMAEADEYKANKAAAEKEAAENETAEKKAAAASDSDSVPADLVVATPAVSLGDHDEITIDFDVFRGGAGATTASVKDKPFGVEENAAEDEVAAAHDVPNVAAEAQQLAVAGSASPTRTAAAADTIVAAALEEMKTAAVDAGVGVEKSEVEAVTGLTLEDLPPPGEFRDITESLVERNKGVKVEGAMSADKPTQLNEKNEDDDATTSAVNTKRSPEESAAEVAPLAAGLKQAIKNEKDAKADLEKATRAYAAAKEEARKVGEILKIAEANLKTATAAKTAAVAKQVSEAIGSNSQ